MNRLRVADLFTLGNLGAGFFAILSNDVLLGAGLICLGAVLDVFDGWVARRMNQASDLGVQLDSLADMVTFGVAPAILFYRMLPEGWVSMIVCAAIPLASAWRLATFNLLPPSPWFRGLPTPANALWYVGLALWFPKQDVLPEWMYSDTLQLGLSIILSILMVSGFPIPGMKSPSIYRKEWWILLGAFVGFCLPMVFGHASLSINAGLSFFLLACILRVFFQKAN